jgi:hypothetical protein
VPSTSKHDKENVTEQRDGIMVMDLVVVEAAACLETRGFLRDAPDPLGRQA